MLIITFSSVGSHSLLRQLGEDQALISKTVFSEFSIINIIGIWNHFSLSIENLDSCDCLGFVEELS